MKILKETKSKFTFEMADKKTNYGPFPILGDEDEAKVTMTDHLLQMVEQVGIDTLPREERAVVEKQLMAFLDKLAVATKKEIKKE